MRLINMIQPPNKLPFFPSPYPDELLFSIVSRYHERACHLKPEITTLNLFETKRISTNIDSPLIIKVLHDKLPDNTLLTVERFIYKHTMFPFFDFFASAQRSQQVVELSPRPVGVSRKYSLPQRRNGTYSRKSMKGTYLRHCPECYVSDMKTYGESFWHRSHQIYGVDICHKHGEWLIESQVPTRTSMENHRYILPDDKMFNKNKYPAQRHNGTIKHLKRIAKLVNCIMNQHSKKRFDSNTLKQRYYYYLQRHGYLKYMAYINLKKLQNDIVEFYNEQGINTDPITELRYDKFIWLENILEENCSFSHTIDHLLFINFLGISCEELLLEDMHFHKFGLGPWPCLNPAASHFKQDVVVKCDLIYDESLRRTEGLFSCSCGFKYIKHWPYKEEDHYKLIRVINYGEVWEKEFLRLRDEENKKFYEIARRMSIGCTDAEMRYEDMKSDRPLALYPP